MNYLVLLAYRPLSTEWLVDSLACGRAFSDQDAVARAVESA